jgi:hypothetical protein
VFGYGRRDRNYRQPPLVRSEFVVARLEPGAGPQRRFATGRFAGHGCDDFSRSVESTIGLEHAGSLAEYFGVDFEVRCITLSRLRRRHVWPQRVSVGHAVAVVEGRPHPGVPRLVAILKVDLVAPMIPTSSSLRATAGWRPTRAMEALAGCTML